MFPATAAKTRLSTRVDCDEDISDRPSGQVMSSLQAQAGRLRKGSRADQARKQETEAGPAAN
jgi:hypothetical protein